jgi:hypothetical protein
VRIWHIVVFYLAKKYIAITKSINVMKTSLNTKVQKTNRLLLACVIALVGFNLSCKKEPSASVETQAPPRTAEIKIRKNRLSFSQKAFDDIMLQSHLRKSVKYISTIIERLDDHKEFVSLRKEAETVVQTGKVSALTLRTLQVHADPIGPPVEPVEPGGGGGGGYPPVTPTPEEIAIVKLDSLVTDPYFASVLSPAGEVEVENTLYRITDHGTFLVASEDEAELDTFLTALDMGLDLGTNLLLQEEDLFRLPFHPKIFFIDSYGHFNFNSNNNTTSGTSPTNTIMDFPLGENVFTNVDVYEFNDAKTWVGKGLQELFGRDHFKSYNNTSKARLKVNFYSTNWGVFASAGARAVIQTRGWTGLYRPFENFDEMRLGWSNVVIKLDLPPLNPMGTQPGDFWGGVSNVLKSNINFNFKGIDRNFLVYRVDQILAFDQITHTLPLDLKSKLNNLITRLNGAEINIASMLESQLDKQAVERLVKYIKANAEDKTKDVALTTTVTNANANTIGKIVVPQSWEYKYNADGDAVMSQTFDFQTAMIGVKNGEFTFKFAKSVKIETGDVTALGKLNGEWVGMSVVKK